jgi:hypothetical protein
LSPVPPKLPGTLRERRVLFTRLLADLLVWAAVDHPEWEIAIDEAKVASPRAVRDAKGDRIICDDAVHVRGSKHHTGEAADLLLYIGGQYIADGDHPAWRTIAEKWESLHPAATSGRRFRDGNHCSLDECDRSEPMP